MLGANKIEDLPRFPFHRFCSSSVFYLGITKNHYLCIIYIKRLISFINQILQLLSAWHNHEFGIRGGINQLLLGLPDIKSSSSLVNYL